MFVSQAFCVIRSDFNSVWHAGGIYTNQISNANVTFSALGGGINGLVAVNIYENGGYFCPVRISRDTNSVGTNSAFIYSARDTTNCKTICKPEYQGTECNTKTTNNTTCTATDYESFFQDTIKTLTGFNRIVSQSMNIFGSGTNSGTSVQNGQTYYTDTLGIIDFVENGVVVAPIRFSISSAGAIARTSPNSTILCATGYIVDNNKCVKSENCSTGTQEPNASDYNACRGYNMDKYDATIHVLKTKTQDNCTDAGIINICHGSETCTYFECRDGYGTDPNDSTKCISCGSDIRSGTTSGGTCVTCPKGEYYDKTAFDYCSPATEISKSRMERHSGVDCWPKTDKSDYKDCVI